LLKNCRSPHGCPKALRGTADGGSINPNSVRGTHACVQTALRSQIIALSHGGGPTHPIQRWLFPKKNLRNGDPTAQLVCLRLKRASTGEEPE
jgi:hypothetical protein